MYDRQLEKLVIEKGATNPKSVNVALQHGRDVITEKKKTADCPNRHDDGTVTDPRKLDTETEEFSHQHLSKNFTVTLQQARMHKKFSQADLAKAINEKANVIADYENGKIIPNPSTVTKLSRVLDVKLNKHM